MEQRTTTARRVAPVSTFQFGGRTEGAFSLQEQPAAMWPDFLKGQPGTPVRVMLVEDDPHMRLVIAQELLTDQRINLVAQASSLREARRLISAYEFDVILVDLPPGDDLGYELIKCVKHAFSGVEVVVISSTEDEQHALHAFDLGATGYLIKNSWFGNFAQAVLQVVNGGASITPSMARRLLRRYEHSQIVPINGNGKAGEDNHQLSEREKAVLRMVAMGHTSNEIGDRLCISCLTVNTHIKNIYRKLHVHTRAQAVSFATQAGIL